MGLLLIRLSVSTSIDLHIQYVTKYGVIYSRQWEGRVLEGLEVFFMMGIRLRGGHYKVFSNGVE